MGVAVENRTALDLIESAEAIDRICDQVTRDAVRQADRILADLARKDVEAARADARAERADLIEIERLGRAEESAWGCEAPRHIQASSDEARQIIAVCGEPIALGGAPCRLTQ